MNWKLIIRLAVGLLTVSFCIHNVMSYVGMSVMESLWERDVFLFIVGGNLGFLVCAFPLRTIASSFSIVITKSKISVKQREQAQRLFKFMGRGFIVLAGLATAMGLASLGVRIDKPEEFGPPLAMIIAGWLYSVFFYGVLKILGELARSEETQR